MGRFANLADDDFIESVKELERLGRRVDALRTLAAGEAAERSRTADMEACLASRHGCRNATELMQRLTLASTRTITRRIRLADAVRDRVSLTGEPLQARHPFIAAALHDGTLPIESAAQIAGMLDGLPRSTSPDAEACAEANLVASATGAPPPEPSEVTPPVPASEPGGAAMDGTDTAAAETTGDPPAHADSIRVMCRVWRAALDQDGPAPSDAIVQQKRFFALGRQRDGIVPVRGAVLPEVAALLARLFDAVNSPRVAGSTGDDGTDTTRPTGSAVTDNATELDIGSLADDRSPGQKRHDALATIAQIAARHPETPLLGGAPVTVLLQATASALSGGPDKAWLLDHTGEVSPVTPEALHHAVCSGAVERVLQNDQGRVVGLGSRGRIFNASQRRAIILRDGGCVIPGCTVPATWCEIHHVTPHADGGPTHIDNGAMLCWHHHRTLDSSGWSVAMIGGLPHVKAPTWIDRTGRWRRARPATQAPRPRC